MATPASSSFPLPDKLPIIDIAPLLSADPSFEAQEKRKGVADALHWACVDYGFFYLNIAAYVDPKEPEELSRLGREFFGLPQTEKDKLALSNQDHARGYARLKENVTNGKADNHEGLDFYRPVEDPDKTKPLWGENQWPSTPIVFREKYEVWVEKMKKLGLIVMEAMAEGLQMTKEEWNELRAQVDDSFWVMRVIGYPPLPNDHDGFSCGAHKDYGCLTFLYADPTPNALQVFLPRPGTIQADASGLPAEGGEEGIWITADPIPGCVVCNIGEMWETWTNGLYRSTLHRVVHRGSNYRIPFFFEPNFDALVKPLDAARRICDTQNRDKREPLREPIVYGEFLKGKVGGNFATGKDRYSKN
ncbi:Clavaminate synthase-like protein [Macrolepiota fuliginosa MF-IS2]|uniref:Clavaminate synthase-like protein n=1 Tax=Macrolepiota fuliginosa MF-IS2 TaxID=1400762 RepID=A0A9P5XPZ1_9AGAR|nr:Clavaminate synthase-like protein [Macrolepiota fuliginosa MF-IS2]